MGGEAAHITQKSDLSELTLKYLSYAGLTRILFFAGILNVAKLRPGMTLNRGER
jgi:hypothetical protein